MSNLFSNEKVNVGRQAELDVAKALSIIFMVFLHAIMVVKGYNVGLSPTYDFVISNVLDNLTPHLFSCSVWALGSSILGIASGT